MPRRARGNKRKIETTIKKEVLSDAEVSQQELDEKVNIRQYIKEEEDSSCESNALNQRSKLLRMNPPTIKEEVDIKPPELQNICHRMSPLNIKEEVDIKPPKIEPGEDFSDFSLEMGHSSNFDPEMFFTEPYIPLDPYLQHLLRNLYACYDGLCIITDGINGFVNSLTRRRF